MTISRFYVLTALALIPVTVAAQPGGGDRPPPPPTEALEACDGLEVDDECSFVLDDETIEGTCMEGPRADLPLACRPASKRR